MSGNVIQKTVVIGNCDEDMCHEREVADLMALKTACGASNFIRKYYNGGYVSTARELENGYCESSNETKIQFENSNNTSTN